MHLIRQVSMTRSFRASLLTALLAGISAPGLAAQATISTEAAASAGITTSTETMGQTFAAPDPFNTVLQSFRVAFGTYPESREYVARLMRWLPGTQRLTGPTLFQSAVGTTVANTSSTFVTFHVGGIALDPTATYIFFLSVAGDDGMTAPGSDIYSPSPYTAGSTYTTGVGMFDGVDTSAQWNEPFSNLGGLDLAFTAQFTPDATVTPEPATLALLGTGLAGMAGARRRRRRREAEEG